MWYLQNRVLQIFIDKTNNIFIIGKKKSCPSWWAPFWKKRFQTSRFTLFLHILDSWFTRSTAGFTLNDSCTVLARFVCVVAHFRVRNLGLVRMHSNKMISFYSLGICLQWNSCWTSRIWGGYTASGWSKKSDKRLP